MSPRKVTGEDPTETRVHDLEIEMRHLREQAGFAERTLKDMADQFDALTKEVAWLRKRLAHLLPERHYCPHCKATVHKDARACGACGKSWGPKPDPKAGLPG